MSKIGPDISIDNLICWFDPIISGFEKSNSNLWHSIKIDKQKTVSSEFKKSHFNIARKKILSDLNKNAYLHGLKYQPVFDSYEANQIEASITTSNYSNCNLSTINNIKKCPIGDSKSNTTYKNIPGTFISMFNKSREYLIQDSGNFSITITINIDKPQIVISKNGKKIRKKQSILALLEEKYKHFSPGKRIVIGIKSPYYRTSTNNNYKQKFSPFSFFVNIDSHNYDYPNPYGYITIGDNVMKDNTKSFTIQTDYKFEFKKTYVLTFVYSSGNTARIYVNGQQEKIVMMSGKIYHHGFRKTRNKTIKPGSFKKMYLILQPGFKNWYNDIVSNAFYQTLPDIVNFSFRLFRIIPYNMTRQDSYLYNPFVTIGNAYLHNINLNSKKILNIYNSLKKRF